MSERTTIGGTVYEAIGSSSSNLLLKCNGTARIQWGSKLIDLIKNGKIASEGSLELIFTVTDESQINSDGIYILTTEESDKLIVCKDGNKYNFTDTDLYISASKELDLTVEQKKQALDNIGLYYDTLEELLKANLKTGLVYVIENQTLYTIKDGVILEFEAKLKTVTVDEATDDGVKVINSSVKIVLSILDEEYLVLADLRIMANYSIYVKNSAQLGSENADATQGYRLYIDGDTSYLDVDEINVRNGIKVELYKELLYEDFKALMGTKLLEPHAWYVITDFLNHWKLAKKSDTFNRPILIRALTEDTLYEKGYLFANHNIIIHYDPEFDELITQLQEVDGVVTEVDVSARGKITWMKDCSNNNEANFDFLDYTDAEGNELCTLHFLEDFDIEDTEELQLAKEKAVKSIFPKYSHDNKLTVYDLKGTIIVNKAIDDSNATVIDFLFDDSEDKLMMMYNNTIECRSLTLTPTCTTFCNNTLAQSIKLVISKEFLGNEFLSIYSREDLAINEVEFSEIEDNTIFKEIALTTKIENVKCKEFKHCTFSSELSNCVFGTIENITFTKPVNNSTINEIKNEVTLSSEITDSYIGTISDTSIIDAISIAKCHISNIKTSTISGNLNNSSLEDINESALKGSISNSTFKNVDNSIINGNISNSVFDNLEGTTINETVTDSIFTDIQNCTFNASFNLVKFKLLSGSTFDTGTITNVESFYDLSTSFNSTYYNLLYNTDKRKEIYINNGIVQVICIPEVIFYRGMIIMHSGIEDIPLGWAICDGGTYEWNGKSSTTPNLVDKFIKAVGDTASIGETLNESLNEKNELKLKKEHLPKHYHEIDVTKLPQYTTDEIEGNTSRYDPLSLFVNTDSGTLSVSVGVSVSVSVTVGDSSDSSSDSDYDSDSITLSGTTINYLGTGANYESIAHKHLIDWGSENLLTEENDKDVEQEPIKLEPNYYSLIFIMKL